MANNYDAYLCKVMNLFTKAQVTEQMLLEIQPDASTPLCKIRKLKPHTEFVFVNTEAHTIFILVSGSCQCTVHSYMGDSVTVDTMMSPYVFGLMEPVLNIPRYTASVITNQASCVVEVPVNIFIHAMRNNLTVANACISYFVNVSQYYMDMAEIRALYDINDTLLLYLFNNCSKAVFPYMVGVNRKTMSHLLHIDLRTLYRYLGKLRSEGYFEIQKGKIRISIAQYEKLKEYCTENLGTRPQSMHVYPDTFQDEE